MASEELEPFDNVVMLHQDILKNKNTFDPPVIEAVKQQMEVDDSAVFKLCANLPYNIATPILTTCFDAELVPSSMTVTIQKEWPIDVGQPGSKDYLALVSGCRALAIVNRAIMSPKVFRPRPKVQSAIIPVDFNPEKRASIPDLDFFHAFVRAMFFHRRKFMRSVTISAFEGQLDKQQVDDVLAAMQFVPMHEPNNCPSNASRKCVKLSPATDQGDRRRETGFGGSKLRLSPTLTRTTIPLPPGLRGGGFVVAGSVDVLSGFGLGRFGSSSDDPDPRTCRGLR